METLSPQTSAKPNDVKAESSFEFWLKRQFPQHTLRAMREALKMLDDGAPVPYIAFYQKEAIETLKSADLYKLREAKTEWAEIARKQNHLLKEIEAQGKLTPELKQTIERSYDLDRLEDLFIPFKLKRQTLGVLAREAGLGRLADYLWDSAHGTPTEEITGETLADKAASFVKADTKYATVEAVLKGVQDIFVERIAESFELRSLVRDSVLRRSKLKSVKGSKAKANSRYAKFFEYQEPIGSMKKASSSHRYLAMRKGWMEDELVLSFERPDEGVLLEKFEEFACPNKEALGHEVLTQAARLALKGNVYTVMENEAHRSLKEEAEKHVIDVMAENLRKKLLRPAFGQKAIMGIDPGSTGQPCSLALVDAQGKFLLNLSFKLEEATDSMKEEFLKSIENLQIEAIAVAHGSQAKEVRDGFRKILETSGKQLPIVSIHEHSANIYASSPAAKEEFPELDINTRRAVFVARYLQNPLAALLRLDTKFFSLGELQHEVNHGKLRQALSETIEFAVNFAGVDLNTAPAYLLAQVAGLNMETAKAIVQYREANGAFKTRSDIHKVPGMNDKNFEFSAGFLKVRNGAPLENTFIHPKFYAELEKALAGNMPGSLTPEQLSQIAATLLPIFGDFNSQNICYELDHLGQDPRGAFEAFQYNSEIKTIADLKKDTPYPGIVTNVTSFGAFVDIGIEQDGLVHISELTQVVAKNPFDSLFPGDIVTVFVGNVNAEKKQISLSMKDAAHAPRPRKNAGPRQPRGERRPPRRAPQAPQLNADGTPMAAPEGEAQERRPRFKRWEKRDGEAAATGAPGERPARGEHRGRGPRDDKRAPKEDKKPKRPPQRDSKTGALMKAENEYKATGPRLPSKAKVTTFNPFANLGALLKEKEKDKSNN